MYVDITWLSTGSSWAFEQAFYCSPLLQVHCIAGNSMCKGKGVHNIVYCFHLCQAVLNRTNVETGLGWHTMDWMSSVLPIFVVFAITEPCHAELCWLVKFIGNKVKLNLPHGLSQGGSDDHLFQWLLSCFCINEEVICYQLWDWKITYQHFDWMLQLSSVQKWRSVNY